METIEVGSARAERTGRYEGMLKVGAMPDGAPVDLPGVIVRGTVPGPVLWMHGCVHGNEYCGTFAIHAFLRSLRPEQVKGAVVALPLLNITASRMRQRMMEGARHDIRALYR